MKRVVLWCLVLLCATTPLTGQSSRGPEGEPSPAALVLSHRSALALSAQQVQALERADRRTAAENSRLREVVDDYHNAVDNAEWEGESGRGGAEVPGRMRQRREQMRTAVLQLGDNLRREAAEVRAILTDAQAKRLGELMEQGPPAMTRGGENGDRGV